MTGHDAFKQIVDFVDQTDQSKPLINKEDFELWQKDVIWDALHGIRYGQSFCNRFGVSDNLLYYTTWPPEQLDEYIRNHYVERA